MTSYGKILQTKAIMKTHFLFSLNCHSIQKNNKRPCTGQQGHCLRQCQQSVATVLEVLSQAFPEWKKTLYKNFKYIVNLACVQMLIYATALRLNI